MKTVQWLMLSLTFLLSFSATSQIVERNWIKGYYINLNGEKINGYFVASGKKYDFIRFRTQNEGAITINLSPSEAKVVSDNNNYHFQSQTVVIRGESELMWIRKVVSGKMNMYRGFDKEGWRYYLINRIDIDSIIIIPPNAMKPFFKTVLKDCPDALQENYIYTYDDLIFTIRQANRCLGSEPKELGDYGSFFTFPKSENSPPRARFGIEGFLESNFGNSTYNTLFSRQTIPSGFPINGGISFLLNYDHLVEFSIGVKYNQLNGDATGRLFYERPIFVTSMSGAQIYVNEQSYSFQTNQSFDVSFLEIPLNIRLILFGKKKLNPFVGVGLTSRKMLSSNYEYLIDADYTATHLYFQNQSPYLTDISFENTNSKWTSFSGSTFINAGFRYQINPRNLIQFSYSKNQFNFSIDTSTDLYTTDGLSDSFTRIARIESTNNLLTVGYIYYFFETEIEQSTSSDFKSLGKRKY